MTESLRAAFGRWWWIDFGDAGMVGPMTLRRARRWAVDAPHSYRILWNRGFDALEQK